MWREGRADVLGQTEGGMIRTYVDEEHFPEESCGTAILASVGL